MGSSLTAGSSVLQTQVLGAVLAGLTFKLQFHSSAEQQMRAPYPSIPWAKILGEASGSSVHIQHILRMAHRRGSGGGKPGGCSAYLWAAICSATWVTGGEEWQTPL